MTERAAHLVDHALPEVPVRQWGPSLAPRVRYVLRPPPTGDRLSVAADGRVVFASRAESRPGRAKALPGSRATMSMSWCATAC